MKKIIIDSLILVGVFIVTFLLGYFAIMWLFGLWAAVFSENGLVVRLFYFVPCFLLVLGVLFVFSFRKEYKRENFMARDSIISSALACAILLILAFVITFVEYTAGPAIDLAKIIYAGADVNKPLLHYEVPDRYYVSCMIVLDVFYIFAYTLGGFYGQKKRARDRDNLTKKR